MSRGRADLNDQQRQHRITCEANYYGNSSRVARACDRFFLDRGLVIDGLRGRITRDLRAAGQPRPPRHHAGDRVETAASDIEASWQP